jgi:mono/diheme cytochrome c family protein
VRLAIVALAVGASLGLGGCGGDDSGSTTSVAETTTAAAATTTAPAAVGRPARGKAIFLSSGCGGCHTLFAAGTTGTTGPNLGDRVAVDAMELDGDVPDYVRESIVDPDAVIAPGGYEAGTMPSTFAKQLTEQQLADLVAYVVQAVGGVQQ